MKKGFAILFNLFFCFFCFSQTKPSRKGEPIKIDTVKTEIIEVVSKYNPKIADANKIEKKPVVKISEKIRRKKLSYEIFSAPVASTFIPKSGVVKGIDVGVKERLYDNYLALGYGNYNSPMAEIYIYKNLRFDDEFGVRAKYKSSLSDIENTLLKSTYSNFLSSIFYKKEQRYFDWKINLETEFDQYNWYGLSNRNFITSTLNNIKEEQNYNYIKASGEIDMLDSYIDKSSISISNFSDKFKSTEFLIDFKTNFDIPIDFINRKLNNLYVRTNLEYLSGSFERDYANLNRVNYSIFTASINPEYKTNFSGFSLQIGTKLFGSFDTENKVNNILIYPDIYINKSISKEKLNIYTGIKGNLNTNTFKTLSDENPYISPTQFITQTSEKYNAFLGLSGNINNSFNFNFSARIKDEQDKPLYVKHNSKSDGINTSLDSKNLLGYEYGNSFNVVYDDIKTISLQAEVEYDFSKNISSKINFEYNNFETQNQLEPWNLPNIKGDFNLKYKNTKWFSSLNVFFVGERKDLLYTTIYPTISNGTRNLDSFVDVNLDGGYHFNDKFSVFLEFNNILNQDYQRFIDFNVQGFQILGGLTYKFDF